MSSRRSLLYRKVKYLLENVRFFPSTDNDTPGNKQIIRFDNSPASLEGDTHGKKSHAIKHLMEFKPDVVDAFLDEAINATKDSPNIAILNVKTGAVLGTGQEATKLITRGAMLNTFDNVNDKVQLGIPLTPEEQIILDIIWKMTTIYVQDLEKDIADATDVDNITDPTTLMDALMSSNVIKFTGIRSGALNNYYLDLRDTGLIAEKQGMIATMFRIDKKGADMGKVARYFETAAQVSNPILMSTLVQMGGAAPAQKPASDRRVAESRLRHLVRGLINETFVPQQVLYTGVVLDPVEVAQLRSKIFDLGLANDIFSWEFSNIAAHGNEQLNHHMTLTPGSLKPGDPLREMFGMPVTLNVVGWGVDPVLGIAAWQVVPPEDLPIKSGNPHITAAMATPAVKPFLASKITRWMPLDEPFSITGVLREVFPVI